MADGVRLRVRKKDLLFANLKRTVPEIETALEQANGQSAHDMVGIARGYVPVRTGALRDSLRAVAPGDLPPRYSQGGKASGKAIAWLVTVGNSAVRYAHFVEFGTATGSPAQPYFFPAYRLIKRRHRGRVTRAINKTLKARGISR